MRFNSTTKLLEWTCSTSKQTR